MERRRARYEPLFAEIAARLPENPVVADVGSGPTCWGRMLPGRRLFVDPLMHSYTARWGEQMPEGLCLAAAGEALPIRDGTCDLVLSLNAIDHCADPEAVVRECARIARPGGLVAVSVYAHPLVRAALSRALEAMGLGDEPHPSSFTRDTLPLLMGKCGLEVVQTLDLGSASFRTRIRWLRRTEPLVVARRPAPTPVCATGGT
jgi:SAM-dependent methyltransferase